MKKTIKLFGIITMVLATVFAMTSCGDDGDSDEGTKTNAYRPNITVQPLDGVYLPGAAVTPLSVTASSSDGGTLSYQWYSEATRYSSNAAAITGATNASFTPSATTAGTLYYYAEVTNTNNSANGTKTAVQTSDRAKFVVGWEKADLSGIGLLSARSIIFANNLFVAVGGYISAGSQIGWSSDGINWTMVTNTSFGNSVINGIAYGNNRFIAVGNGGKMASSTDGKTWTSIDVSSIFGTSDIRDIAYGNSRFFAVADDSKTAYLTNSGSTWTSVSVTTGSLKRIVYGANTFMAYGTHTLVSNGVNYSFANNGTDWNAVGNLKDFMIYDLISTDSLLVEVGANGNVYSGTPWTDIKPSAIMGTDTISNAAYGAGKLFVFSSTEKGAWSSDNGATWTEAPYVDMSRMAYGAGRFVAVAGGSGIYYSTYP